MLGSLQPNCWHNSDEMAAQSGDKRFDRMTALGFRLAFVDLGGEQHMRIQGVLHALKRSIGSNDHARLFKELCLIEV